MKIFIAKILAILILLQPFSKLWIVVSFKINQDRIAQTLCVKKEKKNNTCKGKCYLKKQLKKAEQEQQKNFPSSQKVNSEILFCESLPKSIEFEFIYYPTHKQHSSFYNSRYFSSYLSDIFRPPRLV